MEHTHEGTNQAREPAHRGGGLPTPRPLPLPHPHTPLTLALFRFYIRGYVPRYICTHLRRGAILARLFFVSAAGHLSRCDISRRGRDERGETFKRYLIRNSWMIASGTRGRGESNPGATLNRCNISASSAFVAANQCEFGAGESLFTK